MTVKRGPRTTVEVHGPALRHIRGLTDIDAEAMAKQAQISTRYLWKIERGAQPVISLRLYARLIKALRIDDWRVLLAAPHGQLSEQHCDERAGNGAA